MLHLYFLTYLSFYLWEICQYGNQMNIGAPEQYLNERNFGEAQWCYSFLSKPVYLSQELEIPLVLLGIMITHIVKYYGLKTKQEEKSQQKNPKQTKPQTKSVIFKMAIGGELRIWDRYWVTAWSDAFLFLIFLLTALHLPVFVLHLNDVTRILSWENKVYVMYQCCESAEGTTCL